MDSYKLMLDAEFSNLRHTYIDRHNLDEIKCNFVIFLVMYVLIISFLLHWEYYCYYNNKLLLIIL